MNQLSTWTCYTEMDQEIAKQMENVATGFIYLGYLFKQARDTKYYEEAGYQSVYEYAKEKYNITRTQALRFMQINDVYSIEGYSTEIAPQYIGYGSSKLTEMLGIPEEIREEIPVDITVKDIRNIKATVAAGISENKEENSCATVAQTQENTECEDDSEFLRKIVYLFFETYKEEFEKYYFEVKEGTKKGDIETTTRKDRLLCSLAPSKFAVKRTDLANIMISTAGIRIMPYGKERIGLSLEEFVELFKQLYPNMQVESAEETYWNVYQKPLKEPKLEPKKEVEKKHAVKSDQKKEIKEEKKESKEAAVIEDTEQEEEIEELEEIEEIEDDVEEESEEMEENTDSEDADNEDDREDTEDRDIKDIIEAAGLDTEPIEKIVGEVVIDAEEEPQGDREDIDLEDLHEWIITKENMDTEITNLISYIQEAMKWHGSVEIKGKVK